MSHFVALAVAAKYASSKVNNRYIPGYLDLLKILSRMFITKLNLFFCFYYSQQNPWTC